MLCAAPVAYRLAAFPTLAAALLLSFGSVFRPEATLADAALPAALAALGYDGFADVARNALASVYAVRLPPGCVGVDLKFRNETRPAGRVEDEPEHESGSRVHVRGRTTRATPNTHRFVRSFIYASSTAGPRSGAGASVVSSSFGSPRASTRRSRASLQASARS